MHNLRQDDARGGDDIDDWMLDAGYADGCYRWHDQWVNSLLPVDDEYEVVYCEPWLHAGKV